MHNEVRKDLRDGDLRQLNTTLTRDLVYAMATLNGLAPGGIKRCPRMQLTADETEDMESMSNSLPKLVAIGVQVPKTWANRRLGIPLPQAGEEVLTPAPTTIAAHAAPAVPGTAPAATATLTAQPAPVQPRTVAGAMLPQLARQADPAAGGWVAQLRELVMRAGSLQDIRDGLEQLLPNMTLDQYANALADALATAELAGRHDVLQEAAGYGH